MFMRDWLVYCTEQAIVIIDALALFVILVGTIEACVQMGRILLGAPTTGTERREIWIGYARWLVAGLTFQLAADIIETAVHSDWPTIGRIAAIAAIRTFLNFFLERDLGEIRTRQHEKKRSSDKK
jgi:uncharacterized membrane protein